MTKQRLATLMASIGAGLLSLTAGLHFSGYSMVVSSATTDLKPVMGAAWVAVGASLIFAALLAIAAAPLFMVRRRVLLWIAALTPLSIALLQIAYLGFLPPTALLILDAALLILAGELGRGDQPRPA